MLPYRQVGGHVHPVRPIGDGLPTVGSPGARHSAHEPAGARPDIQEEIFFLPPVTERRPAITEGHLRQVLSDQGHCSLLAAGHKYLTHYHRDMNH
jgi:hypothetical protein